MKKTLRTILLLLLATLILIQFFPTMKNETDTLSDADLIRSQKMPSQVATLIQNACYDCHSSNTQYPWYNKIQPVSWYLEKHIQNAQQQFNFNNFEKYPINKQEKILRNMKTVIENKSMPPASYRFLHPESRLSKDERQLIVNWIKRSLHQ